ncbi:MAG: hypothetical protein ACPGWM_06045 [Flavobacteriales bacterium]
MKLAKYSLILFLFSACAMKPSFEPEITQLKDLIVEVQQAKEVYENIDAVKVSSVASESKVTMSSFNKNYKGQLSKEQASIVNDLNNVKRLIKDFDRQNKRVADEFTRTETQLNELLSTLEEGNTVDASGNQIDQNYVNKQMGIETKVAQSLIREVGELDKRCNNALDKFELAKPAMENLMNELLP